MFRIELFFGKPALLFLQECDVIFESWGTPLELLQFRWLEDDNIVDQQITLNQHDFKATFEESSVGDATEKYSTGERNSVGKRPLRILSNGVAPNLLHKAAPT